MRGDTYHVEIFHSRKRHKMKNGRRKGKRKKAGLWAKLPAASADAALKYLRIREFGGGEYILEVSVNGAKERIRIQLNRAEVARISNTHIKPTEEDCEP